MPLGFHAPPLFDFVTENARVEMKALHTIRMHTSCVHGKLSDNSVKSYEPIPITIVKALSIHALFSGPWWVNEQRN